MASEAIVSLAGAPRNKFNWSASNWFRVEAPARELVARSNRVNLIGDSQRRYNKQCAPRPYLACPLPWAFLATQVFVCLLFGQELKLDTCRGALDERGPERYNRGRCHAFFPHSGSLASRARAAAAGPRLVRRRWRWRNASAHWPRPSGPEFRWRCWPTIKYENILCELR